MWLTLPLSPLPYPVGTWYWFRGSRASWIPVDVGHDRAVHIGRWVAIGSSLASTLIHIFFFFEGTLIHGFGTQTRRIFSLFFGILKWTIIFQAPSISPTRRACRYNRIPTVFGTHLPLNVSFLYANQISSKGCRRGKHGWWWIWIHRWGSHPLPSQSDSFWSVKSADEPHQYVWEWMMGNGTYYYHWQSYSGDLWPVMALLSL